MKNLTPRYSLTQFTFWAAYSGTTAFATTYLLNQGLSSGTVGVLLALSGIGSCLAQPVLAARVDRAKGFLLTKILLHLSILCFSCFCLLLIPKLPQSLIAVLYTVGLWSSDVMIPLLNALCVSFHQAGYPVNYGAVRGIGSTATAISSLVLGFVIAKLGMTWMLLLLLLTRSLCIFSLLGYPKLQKPEPAIQEIQGSCSLFRFFQQYPRYCLTLLGIAFLGMFLAMTENYMIAIVRAFGGNSSHVGTALFLSSLVTAPVIFCFDRIHARLSDAALLRISAVTFLIRAVCFLFVAKSISAVYLLQLLHMTSYGFLHPTQVSYAGAMVRPADMVKGQAFSAAAYALGCSAGNLAGGIALGFGVRAMLSAGVVMAGIGTGILFFTTAKSSPKGEISK